MFNTPLIDMQVRSNPPNVVDILKDGFRNGDGYVILGNKNGLVVHYLAEWWRFQIRAEINEGIGERATFRDIDYPESPNFLLTDEEVLETPVRSYGWFVKTEYRENQEAVNRILKAANQEALKELDKIRGEFNSILPRGFPRYRTIDGYVQRVDTILRE